MAAVDAYRLKSFSGKAKRTRVPVRPRAAAAMLR